MPTAERNVAERDSFEHQEVANVDVPQQNVLVSDVNAEEELASHWDEVIDRRLIKWGEWSTSDNVRRSFAEEGFVSPTGEAIRKAYKFVKYMRDEGWPLPTGIVPDGEGGIAFENRQDPLYQRIEIDDRGVAYLVTFRDCMLRERGLIDVE